MCYENSVNKMKEIYTDKVNQYKDRPEGACWSSKATQEKRFEILTKIGNLEGCKILDYGCGTGALAGYLKKNKINVDYYGCDIVDEALIIAKHKFPECHFGYFEDFFSEQFDYIFLSGLFNNKLDDNVAYYEEILKKLFPLTKKGIAFNMMSTYVDYYDEMLYYENPERIFTYIKQSLTPYITIRNDYLVKSDVNVPFEFSVYAYKRGN